VRKEKAGILVDEQFGAAILRDAEDARVRDRVPAEKSGRRFDFEYGEDLQTYRGFPTNLLQVWCATT